VAASIPEISENAVLVGPQVNEPMRVLGSPVLAIVFVVVNLVGGWSSTFKGLKACRPQCEVLDED
jgi:hypothetical protein